MTHTRVTWLVNAWHDSLMCAMTWHDSSMCAMTYGCVPWLILIPVDSWSADAEDFWAGAYYHSYQGVVFCSVYVRVYACACVLQRCGLRYTLLIHVWRLSSMSESLSCLYHYSRCSLQREFKSACVTTPCIHVWRFSSMSESLSCRYNVELLCGFRYTLLWYGAPQCGASM